MFTEFLDIVNKIDTELQMKRRKMTIWYMNNDAVGTLRWCIKFEKQEKKCRNMKYATYLTWKW